MKVGQSHEIHVAETTEYVRGSGVQGYGVHMGLERNNLGNSDPKCVADLVGLIFTKPQA